MAEPNRPNLDRGPARWSRQCGASSGAPGGSSWIRPLRPKQSKGPARGGRASWAGLLRYGPVIAVLPSGAPPVAVPSPAAPPFLWSIGGLRGEKRGPAGETKLFAPDSVPFLAVPPVLSGGGFVVEGRSAAQKDAPRLRSRLIEGAAPKAAPRQKSKAGHRASMHGASG